MTLAKLILRQVQSLQRISSTGDWFRPARAAQHHTRGVVYLDGNWSPRRPALRRFDEADGSEALWFGEVDREMTDPSGRQFKGRGTPIGNAWRSNVRAKRCSIRKRRASITFTFAASRLEDAATPWAPPTS